MYEIINYRNLSEDDKDILFISLIKTSFQLSYDDIEVIKIEMKKSKGNSLPQYIFSC